MVTQIQTQDIATSAITETKIADLAVTNSKLFDPRLKYNRQNNIPELQHSLNLPYHSMRGSDVSIGADIKGIVFDGNGYMWVVVVGTSVKKIDIKTGTVAATIAIASLTAPIFYDGSGYVWVSDGTNLHKIDIILNTYVSFVHAGNLIGAANGYIFVFDSQIRKILATTGALAASIVTTRTTFNNGYCDGKFVYITHGIGAVTYWSQSNILTDTFVADSGSAYGAIWFYDGVYIWLQRGLPGSIAFDAVNPETLSVVKTFSPTNTVYIALFDGFYFWGYDATAAAIVKFDPQLASYAADKSYALSAPPIAITFAFDGNHVWAPITNGIRKFIVTR